MITLKETLRLHTRSIQDYGGSEGIRDNDGLEAALGRPFATYGGENLYKSVHEQAAAIAESIIINHPFVDGNKRTGFLLMNILLLRAGIIINATKEEAYAFTIRLATGETRFEEAVAWLRDNSTSA